MTREQLEGFLKQHYRLSYLWARQCCGFDSEMAEEVLQIALLKILEGKAVFNGKSDEKTWLFAVIRFTAFDQMRKEKKHLRLEVFQEIATRTDQREEHVDKSFHEAMLLQLPTRQREVLLLVFYHGKSLEEAASILDISPGSVSTHYDRAKKKLKKLIVNQRLTSDGTH
jgi:RNA polymerase sigma factor (sigma-70 family)